MSDLDFQRIGLTSSLQEPVDQWTVEMAGSAHFRPRAAGPLNIEIGFLDEAGTPHVLDAITDGLIDEWSFDAARSGGSTQLRGWGPAKRLHEEYSKLYVRFPEPPLQSGEILIPKAVGIFRASQVAAEVCAAAGYACAWQCRDYELWENFDATGRRIDILQRLVAPWCSVEPSRVDIFVQGTTVYLRARKAFPTVPDFALTIDADAVGPKLLPLSVKLHDRVLPIVGALTLIGRNEPGDQTHVFQHAIGFSGVDSIATDNTPMEQEEDGTFSPGETSLYSHTASIDPATQQMKTRVITKTTYRMPNQALIYQQKDEYVVTDGVERLAKQEAKWINYQPFTYDAKGPTNSPMPVEEVGATYAWRLEHDANGTPFEVFAQLTKDHTWYTYDENNYLTAAAIFKEKERINEGNSELIPFSYSIKYYQDLVPLVYLLQASLFAYVESSAGSNLWTPVLVTGDATQVAGHRPGGPNRPATKPMNKDLAGLITAPINFSFQIHTLGDSVVAGSPHMSEADLAFIRAQQEEASGLHECTIAFTALAMPWLQRGTLVQISGIKDRDEDGTVVQELVTGIALVYAVDLALDIPGRSCKANVKAVWYEAAD